MTSQPTSPPLDPAITRAVGPDLPLLISGSATAAAVLVADWFTRGTLGRVADFYLWVLVPVGAIVVGFAAASGYYVGAKWLQLMPTRTMLYNAAVTGLATWVALKWIDWNFATFGDTQQRVAESVSFIDYWLWQAAHSTLAVGSAGTIANPKNAFDVGTFGYILEALRCAGFLAGGTLIYVKLTDAPACLQCRRYFGIKRLAKALTADDLVAGFNNAKLTLPDISPSVTAVLRKRGPFRSFTLQRYECPHCHALRVAILMVHGKRENTTRLGAWAIEPEHMDHLATATEAQLSGRPGSHLTRWLRRR